MIIGIDPDLTSTAIAVYDPMLQKMVRLALVRARGYQSMLSTLPLELERMLGPYIAGVDAVVIEGQKIYQTRTGGKEARADKNDLVHLAHVTGICYGLLASHPSITPYVVEPSQWKGQRTKIATGTKLMNALGWRGRQRGGKDPYIEMFDQDSICKTSDGRKVKASDWKHLVDAAGMALWGSEAGAKRLLATLN